MAAFAGGGGGGIDLGYVADGLVLHLDGILKGQDSLKWESLVGSTSFALNSSATAEQNAVSFDGSGGITPDNPVTANFNSSTIEICAQFLESQTYAFLYTSQNVATDLSVFKKSGGFNYKIPRDNYYNSWNFTNANSIATSPFVLSIHEDGGLLNGENESQGSSEGWAVGDGCRIAGFTGYNYNAKIRIFSIRIYNRKLTKAEMLFNQQVDNARFNLGLNI